MQMNANEIICQRFQDTISIPREEERHHYPPCFRVKMNRQNTLAQLDINFEICSQNEEVISTLNLLIPGNVKIEIIKIRKFI